MLQVESTQIEGLMVLTPEVYRDSRGTFAETYNKREMEEAGLTMSFVQDNCSVSKRGVLRGMHIQKRYPQGKLVLVNSGLIFDVVVDLRKNSRTYGQWYGIELSSENYKQLYIPENFAHGFLTLSETASVSFKVTDFFHEGDETGFIWNDPEVGISWPLTEKKHGRYVSEKDLIFAEKDKTWGYLKNMVR